MTRPRIKALALALISMGLIAALSGCDANENADLENGRDLFVSKCGTCHALKEAATTQMIGPDLDSSFAAARAAGMDQDTVEGVVSAQIENPRQVDESDPTYMAPNIVEGTDAEDVATYVASVAGVPGIEAQVAPGGPGGQVYATAGCGACHTFAAAESAGNVGPNLDTNLPDQSEDMVLKSIVDPESIIVDGFGGGLMPASYGDSIEAADLDLLVKFLSDCAGVDLDAPNVPKTCVAE